MELKGELFTVYLRWFVFLLYNSGNIRVYVRVRPVVKGEKDEASGQAAIVYPDQLDHKEIELTASTESATGNQRKEVSSFAFDRVGVIKKLGERAYSCLPSAGVRAKDHSRRNVRRSLPTGSERYRWIQRDNLCIRTDGIW